MGLLKRGGAHLVALHCRRGAWALASTKIFSALAASSSGVCILLELQYRLVCYCWMM